MNDFTETKLWFLIFWRKNKKLFILLFVRELDAKGFGNLWRFYIPQGNGGCRKKENQNQIQKSTGNNNPHSS